MAIVTPLFLLGLPAAVVGAIESTGAAPAITSDGGGATAAVSVSVGDTAVTTVVASDTGTITYSIVGGAEALMFEIDPDTGALAFTETSVGGEYEVIVAATSDWGVDTQTITVTVATYEGPLDLVPGVGLAWSIARALSAARLGQPIATIKRSSDNATQSFNADSSTGEAPNAAIAAFIGAGTGQSTILNDHSGAGADLSPSTGSWLWTANAQNGKPSLAVGAAGSMGSELASIAFVNGATIFCVSTVDVDFGFYSNTTSSYMQFTTGLSGNRPQLDLFNSANSNEAGGRYEPIPGAGFHICEAAWEFGSGGYTVDGADLTKSSDFDSGGAVGTMDGLFSFINQTAAGVGLIEVIIYPSVLTAPQRLALRQNIATYYGITL